MLTASTRVQHTVTDDSVQLRLTKLPIMVPMNHPLLDSKNNWYLTKHFQLQQSIPHTYLNSRRAELTFSMFSDAANLYDLQDSAYSTCFRNLMDIQTNSIHFIL